SHMRRCGSGTPRNRKQARAGTESSEPTTSCREVPGDEHPLLIALLHELMPVEAHAPLLAEAARHRAAAPAGDGGFESQRLAQLPAFLIQLGWLPSHCALSFARSDRHAPALSRSRRGLLLLFSAARVKKSSSRRAGASRNRQNEEGVAPGLHPAGPPWLSCCTRPETCDC